MIYEPGSTVDDLMAALERSIQALDDDHYVLFMPLALSKLVGLWGQELSSEDRSLAERSLAILFERPRPSRDVARELYTSWKSAEEASRAGTNRTANSICWLFCSYFGELAARIRARSTGPTLPTLFDASTWTTSGDVRIKNFGVVTNFESPEIQILLQLIKDASEAVDKIAGID